MGFFSSGTEGDAYHDRYCTRCVHDIDEDRPVWGAHLTFNFDGKGVADHVLHRLIPRDGNQNGKCNLFLEKGAMRELFEVEG